MLLSTLDTALRGATVALLLVLAASLFRGFGTVLAGRLAAAFALGSVAHAVSYSIGSTSPVTTAHAPLIALSTGNVVGMHFFNPAHIMKLVEIVEGHQTSPGSVAAARGLAEAMGKKPVIAKDTPGFIVNRVARPFYGEALRLLGEGVTTAEEIDRIARLEGNFKIDRKSVV